MIANFYLSWLLAVPFWSLKKLVYENLVLRHWNGTHVWLPSILFISRDVWDPRYTKPSKTSCVAHSYYYHIVWCLRPLGRNLRTLRSYVTIFEVQKGGVIIKPIQQNLQTICSLIYFITQRIISNICWGICTTQYYY